jgi:hypothetical protein
MQSRLTLEIGDFLVGVCQGLAGQMKLKAPSHQPSSHVAMSVCFTSVAHLLCVPSLLWAMEHIIHIIHIIICHFAVNHRVAITVVVQLAR